jgi:hypothetical protein
MSIADSNLGFMVSSLQVNGLGADLASTLVQQMHIQLRSKLLRKQLQKEMILMSSRKHSSPRLKLGITS